MANLTRIKQKSSRAKFLFWEGLPWEVLTGIRSHPGWKDKGYRGWNEMHSYDKYLSYLDVLSPHVYLWRRKILVLKVNPNQSRRKKTLRICDQELWFCSPNSYYILLDSPVKPPAENTTWSHLAMSPGHRRETSISSLGAPHFLPSLTLQPQIRSCKENKRFTV